MLGLQELVVEIETMPNSVSPMFTAFTFPRFVSYTPSFLTLEPYISERFGWRILFSLYETY